MPDVKGEPARLKLLGARAPAPSRSKVGAVSVPAFRQAFTLIELLTAICIIGMLMALLLPAVQ